MRNVYYTAILGATIAKQLNDLIHQNCFHVIDSQEELDKYINENGNRWIVNNKMAIQKQYNILHPKTGKGLTLIEANSFQTVIEKEQMDELVEYIFANCPVKKIQIKRVECSGVGARAKVKDTTNVMGAEVQLNRDEENYYIWENPNGSSKTIEPRKTYLWLDKSLMRSIAMLSEGGRFSQQYSYDYSFGLKIDEAHTIGLKTDLCKEYLYSIYIEC